MTKNNFSNEQNKRSWPKKEKSSKMEITHNIIELDDSLTIEDDVNKDPDWRRTPLYNRIRKIEVK